MMRSVKRRGAMVKWSYCILISHVFIHVHWFSAIIITTWKTFPLCWMKRRRRETFWTEFRQVRFKKIIETGEGSSINDPLGQSNSPASRLLFSIFCENLKSGDICEYSDHYRPWLWVGLVDQNVSKYLNGETGDSNLANSVTHLTQFLAVYCDYFAHTWRTNG